MLALPVPAFVSLLLGFLLAHAILRRRYHPLLIALISLCALQSLIITLHQFYGVDVLRRVQPVTATLIPPVAWLAFVTTAGKTQLNRDALLHTIAPAFCAFCAALAPVALDIIVPATFVGYGVALLLATLKDGGDLPAVRLESGNVPKHLWQVIAASLLVSAASDILIVITQISGVHSWQPVIVTVFSSMTLLALGLLSLSRELNTHRSADTTATATTPPPAQQAAADAELMHTVSRLMQEQHLYLDPDLSLARLARKAATPAKALSATINRSCGENVSRHINRYRIEHACTLLRQGKPVTTTIFECGFNTKSNFNREFLRVMKASPSQWLADQPATEPPGD